MSIKTMGPYDRYLYQAGWRGTPDQELVQDGLVAVFDDRPRFSEYVDVENKPLSVGERDALRAQWRSQLTSGRLGGFGGPMTSSLSGFGSIGVDPSQIAQYVVNQVRPPLVAAVKQELPGLVQSIRPVVQEEGAKVIASLQPQVEAQAKQAALQLRPIVDAQATVLEARFRKLVNDQVASISASDEMRQLKRQAVAALVVQAALIVGGMFLVEKYWGRH